MKNLLCQIIRMPIDISIYLFYQIFSETIEFYIMPSELSCARFFKKRNIAKDDDCYDEFHNAYIKYQNHPMVKWYHPKKRYDRR